MKKLLTLAVALIASWSLASAQCEIPLQIIESRTKNDIPEAAQKTLMSRLTTAAIASGEISENYNAPFILTARFDHLNKGVLPGPPMQHTVTTELTLMMSGRSSFEDKTSNRVFATTTLTLKGVGNSEEKALMNAMKRLTGKNQALRDFIAEGRNHIIDFYNKNTPQLIERAEKAAALGNYDEALSFVVQVPECSSGYSAALKATKKYYKQYADYMGNQVVKQARALWASDPTPEQVTEILNLLEMVPVGSAAENDADNLYKEMEASLKDDRKFETREKYADALDLEKRSLDAARQVGVAYGQGPKADHAIIFPH